MGIKRFNPNWYLISCICQQVLELEKAIKKRKGLRFGRPHKYKHNLRLTILVLGEKSIAFSERVESNSSSRRPRENSLLAHSHDAYVTLRARRL